MANKPTERTSARQAAVDVLAEAGKPLALREIVDGALSKATHLGGNNAKGTIRSQVILSSNAVRYFKRTAPGIYGLLEEAQPPKPRKRRKAAAKSR